MRLILCLFVMSTFYTCQKSKWNRKFEVRSGKYKLTRYEVDGKDQTSLIQSFLIDFKNQEPGVGIITELITNAEYSKGYNSCFNIEGSAKIPETASVSGMPMYISFTNNTKIEKAVGFIEVVNSTYGCTRTIRPIVLSRTQFIFEFPFNLQTNKSDTNQVVKEKYFFEKLY
ncbi:MAG: hypothetical protein KJ941_07235 [Bacteroidetes bacterium]|nr:hypothetical protein [Bacteroidota bacterium]